MSKYFKIVIVTLFILFIGLYIIGNSGYYDYEASRKTRLTNEGIEYFENEIENGNELNIDGYLENNKKDYDNLISDATMKISNTISNSFSKALNFALNKMNSALTK